MHQTTVTKYLGRALQKLHDLYEGGQDPDPEQDSARRCVSVDEKLAEIRRGDRHNAPVLHPK